MAGFEELSERARRLEDAGNNGYLDELMTDTPIMLALCHECAKALAPLVEKPATDEDSKSPISDEELAEAWQTMADIVHSFDYDSLVYMLEELDGYKLAEKDKEKLTALQQAAKIPDWDKLKKILA